MVKGDLGAINVGDAKPGQVIEMATIIYGRPCYYGSYFKITSTGERQALARPRFSNNPPVKLNNQNWCRVVDDDTYRRLHDKTDMGGF